MKVVDYVEMDKHDKQTIYEAYSIEAAQRKYLNKLLNKERKEVARMRFQSQAWQDLWLEQDIRANVKIEGDMDEAIDYYFGHPDRQVFFTPNNGYYAMTDEGEYLSIIFANYNHKKWREELKDMSDLIKVIAGATNKPIMYTGVNNVLRNHSVEVEPGLYQLKL